MPFSFFLDESGHSGDAVSSGNAYDFHNQPYFVLAAVGVEDERQLAAQLDRLRTTHGLPAGELKAASLHRKPGVVDDLLALVCDQQLPFFIEVVDKKFFICVHLVMSQLMTPLMGFSEGPQLNAFRNYLLDVLYDEITIEVLDAFVTSCLDPGDETLTRSFDALMKFAAERSSTREVADVRAGMRHMIGETMALYGGMKADDAQAYRRFLPLPDQSSRGRAVWMLPNLSSLTNIYARINKLLHGKLSDVRLIHDQQLQFDQILHDAKLAAEAVTDPRVLPFTPHADFHFLQNASLEFATSHESAGIQVADVLAGATMRFYRDRLRGRNLTTARVTPGLQRLFRASNGRTGIGVNQVMPTSHALMIPTY